MKLTILIALAALEVIHGDSTGAPEQYSTQIYVSASSGIGNDTCWEGGQSLPCNSLSLALVGAQRVSNSVAVVIEPGDYVLSAVSSSTLMLNAVSDFGIIGMDGQNGSVRVNCEPQGAGLTFTLSRGIAIKNVTFNGCGMNTSSYEILSAVHFILCEDVIVSWVSILNSKGTAMAVYDTGGKIDILNSNFDLATASGVYVEFSSSTENASCVICECDFRGNGGGATPTSGGGVTLKFGGESQNNRVTVRSCVLEDNIAHRGAGIFIHFKERSRENSVTVDSTNFSSNIAGSSDLKAGIHSSGGGTKIVLESENAVGNGVIFQDCSFYNNSAYLGGGISVSALANRYDNSTVNDVIFTSSRFEENHASYGAAVDLYDRVLNEEHKSVKATVSGCSFVQNGMPYNKRFSRSFSVVNVNGLATSFIGTTTFSGSTGTPLSIKNIGTDLLDHSILNFTQNTGYDGGALAFAGSGHLTVYNDTRLIFKDNSASAKGGAIYSEYFDEHFSIYSQQCFIRYCDSSVHPNEWNTTLQFSGNRASTKINSIFVSSLIPCVWRSNDHSTPKDDIMQTFCWDNWEYSDGSNCSSEIATSPAYFEETSLSIDVFPGRAATLPLKSFDDLQRNLTDDAAYAAITIEGADTDSRFVTDNTITIYGQPNTVSNLSIQTLDSRVVQAEVSASLLTCPPGFIVKEDRCVCGEGFGGEVTCSEAAFRSFMALGDCMSYDNETQQAIVARCPYYIEYARQRLPVIPLPRNISELTEAVCGPLNREGKLCSTCREGYGIAAISYSFECVKCWESAAARWFVYIIAKFLPLTVFFFVIMFFNVSVTSAPANAFIFFSQVVTISREILVIQAALALFVENGDHAINVIVVPYGVWNLDFFLTLIPRFCVSSRLETPHILVIEYIAAFYPLAFIGFTYLCMKLHGRNFKPVVWLWRPFQRCFGRFRRKWNISTSIIDAIAAFLLLSYSKMIVVSLSLLTPTAEKNDSGDIGTQVLWYDGGIRFFGREHLFYAILAILILGIFAVIPPLLLLLYPFSFFLRFLERLRLRSLALNTFVEVFQGCYKDGTNGTPDRRYFAGIYFAFRVVIFSLFVSVLNFAVLLLTLQFIFTFGAILIVILKPYKVDFYNKLDATVFGILALLYAILLHLYMFFLLTQRISTAALAIFHILVLIPLVYMAVFIGYWLFSCREDWNQKFLKLIRKGRSFDFGSGEHSAHTSTSTTSHRRSDLDGYSIPDRIINPNDYANSTGADVQIVQFSNHVASDDRNSDEHSPVAATENGAQSPSYGSCSPPALLSPAGEGEVELSVMSELNSGVTTAP